MFYSVVIPGILQTKPLHEAKSDRQPGERAAVTMTVEQPAESRHSGTQNDVALSLTMLYEQFRRPIHSYIYRLLGNQEDADDVTQEVFVRACTSWNGLHERDHLSPWLYRIATNLCVDILRRKKRISWWPLSHRNRNNEQSDDLMGDDTSYLLADTGGIPEIAEREHIRQALAHIPEDYAVVLILHAAQGIPYQEIASIIGISPNAAATRISRAKKMFVEQYQRISKDGAGKQEKQR